MDDFITDIIDGCKKQDPYSQEKLYHFYYNSLYTLCRTFFTDKQEIITALNNGMLKVFKNIHQYDKTKGMVFNWVYTIVRNSALSLLKNKNNFSSFQTIENLEESAFENPFKKLEWNDIYLYLDTLPPKTRCICNLFYLQGFSIKEIAVAVDVKEGTVKWHLNESRIRLKQVFQKNYF
jgi:RNA polymerase sigma factor (sigma-70 family)